MGAIQSGVKNIPMLRGKIHIFLILLYVLFLFLLFKHEFELPLKLAYCVLFLSSFFNFSASIVLHNHIWNKTRRSILRRIDYAGIFLMIGGTGFPISVYYMNNDITVCFVLIHWIVIFFGVFGSLLFNFTCTPKWFRSTIYVLCAVPYFYFVYLTAILKYYLPIFLMLCTVFFYGIGSIVYAAQSPNLISGIFESHELFHLFCCFGFISSSTTNYLFWKYAKT